MVILHVAQSTLLSHKVAHCITSVCNYFFQMQSIIGKLHYSGVGATIARATVKRLATSASVTGEIAVSASLMRPLTILSPFSFAQI